MTRAATVGAASHTHELIASSARFCPVLRGADSRRDRFLSGSRVPVLTKTSEFMVKPVSLPRAEGDGLRDPGIPCRPWASAVIRRLDTNRWISARRRFLLWI